MGDRSKGKKDTTMGSKESEKLPSIPKKQYASLRIPRVSFGAADALLHRRSKCEEEQRIFDCRSLSVTKKLNYTEDEQPVSGEKRSFEPTASSEKRQQRP